MLSDNIGFFDGSTVSNMSVDWGSELPDGSIGELFYLDTGDVGLYLHNGTDWAKLGAAAVEEILSGPGELWSWGYNNKGQVGNNSITDVLTPVQVGALIDWETFGSNTTHVTSIIKSDGTLWAYGDNIFGKLGDGTIVPKSSPIQIGVFTTWKQISSASATLAIRNDGTLWSWGNNQWGQLGNETSQVNNVSQPQQVGSLTNWSQVSTRNDRVAAIKTDGTLWAWGSNSYGALGDGTEIPKSSPIQIGSLTNWSYVNCAFEDTFAIKTDGTLWSWGRDQEGVLGSGTTNTHRSSPVQIGTQTNWKTICGSGLYTVLAIKTDGTLWAWGSKDYGLLGDNTQISKSSPIQVGTLTNWKNIQVGDSHAIALKTDGTIWAWGLNFGGALGNGTTTTSSSPIQIGTLNTWRSISAGGYHSSAIK